MLHDLDQIADHLFANAPHQGGTFRRNANHDFAAILARTGTNNEAEILQSRDQTAGRGGGMAHFLRDRRHGEHFFVIEIGEQEKLRERNVARRQFFAEVQQ